VIDGMGVKVKNRATMLLEYAAGKTDRLNNVIATALKVLAEDGKLVSGDKGNLFQTLLAKPYSPSAARAMGNNTLNMMAQLKLVVQSEKQVYVPNPESLLLAFVAPKLSLAFDYDEGEGDGEGDEGEALAATPEGEVEVMEASATEAIDEVLEALV
jgi:hypothetical protein